MARAVVMRHLEDDPFDQRALLHLSLEDCGLVVFFGIQHKAAIMGDKNLARGPRPLAVIAAFFPQRAALAQVRVFHPGRRVSVQPALTGKETKNAPIPGPGRIRGSALFSTRTGQDFAIISQGKVIRAKALCVFIVRQQPGNELGLAMGGLIHVSPGFAGSRRLVIDQLGRAASLVFDLCRDQRSDPGLIGNRAGVRLCFADKSVG